MNYKTRQIWTTMAVTATIFVSFIMKMLSEYNSGGLKAFSDVKFWANTILHYVVTMVVLLIVAMIVLSIVSAVMGTVKNEINKKNNKAQIDIDDLLDDNEDEMDKLIGLKASQISYSIVGVGFVWGLLTIYFDYPFGLMICIQFTSFILANIIESIVKLYFYKRGVIHG